MYTDMAIFQLLSLKERTVLGQVSLAMKDFGVGYRLGAGHGRGEDRYQFRAAAL